LVSFHTAHFLAIIRIIISRWHQVGSGSTFFLNLFGIGSVQVPSIDDESPLLEVQFFLADGGHFSATC